jgi:hypothetical protein
MDLEVDSRHETHSRQCSEAIRTLTWGQFAASLHLEVLASIISRAEPDASAFRLISRSALALGLLARL